MDSLVSAVAARVIFIEGNDISYIEADRPEVKRSCSITEVPRLLMDAYDVELLENTTAEFSFRRLLRKWNEDRGLRMLDIVLDPETPTGERKDAASSLAQIIADKDICDAIQNKAFATPCMYKVDGQKLLREIEANRVVKDFLVLLFDQQKNIKEVREAWEIVSERHFGDSEERAKFELAAVSAGTFRKLAQAIHNSAATNTAVLESLLALKAHPGARQAIMDWTKSFADRRIRRKMRQLEAEFEQVEITSPRLVAQSGRKSHENFEAATRQQQGIVEQLEQGNPGRAQTFTNQLVEWQLQNGGPEYAAKSLCLLAQRAKALGYGSLQLEWSQFATRLAPEDARTHGQAGDAYLAVFRLNEAEDEYKHSSALSDSPFGTTGLARVLRVRGRLDEALRVCVEVKKKYPAHREIYHSWALYSEILREMWRFEEALSSYKEASLIFPEHHIFRCGAAAVLNDMGRLQEALDSYSATIDRFPENPVAYGGRADTLKTMGDLNQALSAYENAIEQFPHEPILTCGRADVLRVMGRHQEALDAYQLAKDAFPYEPAASCGFADTLWESGRIDDALKVYDEAIVRFPLDQRCRTGRANVLRAAGRFEDALQAFDRNVKDLPYDLFSLTGRANLLKLLGHYEDALAAYDTVIKRRPDYAVARYSKAAVLVILERFAEAEQLLPSAKPATASEWVAYHIRGMMNLKARKIEEAIAIFTHGVRENPFHRERLYFENALSAARIRLGEFQAASSLTKIGDNPISQVLRMHSLAELGEIGEATKAYRALTENLPPPILALRDEIAARFRIINKQRAHNDNWILEQETDIILQAA